MNKVILMGRLTKDPEMKYTQASIAVCSFTLAVPRAFKKEEADFVQIIAWQKTAEFCAKYFTKGLRIAVEGRLEISTWKDTAGQTRYKAQVIAEHVHFADSKSDRTDSSGSYNNTYAPARQEQEQHYPDQDFHMDNEDDLPF